MTYFSFLAIFLVIPIVVLLGLAWWDRRRGLTRPAALRTYPIWLIIALHVAVALIYTTPWDNYLVATEVWWYDPARVTGITFGWVPIEEYTFFVLQSILAGLLLFALSRRLPVDPRPAETHRSLRTGVTSVLGVLWIISVILLVAGGPQWNYLTIQLAWALPPIMVQTAFGADILWRYRRRVFITLGSLAVYLSLADALAIAEGIWTISPEQSLHILLGGVLPLEEFTFFVVTNTLLAFGMSLLTARDSLDRLPESLQRRLPPQGVDTTA